MKPVFVFLFLLVGRILPPVFAQSSLSQQMRASAEAFFGSLSDEQKKEAYLAFDSDWRYDWNYTPRSRKGLPLKKMNEAQRKAAMHLLEVALSDAGKTKVNDIIALEYVLRQVEKRPENDTYRDPENYAFLVFGTPSPTQPWGWSVEGHHISLHFTLVGETIEFLPSFFGSNPALVLPGFIQEGKQVLKEEAEAAFTLLHSLTPAQLSKVVLSDRAPSDIVTTNTRRVMLEKREGLSWGDMTAPQQELFKKLLQVYFQRYHVTLKNQALKKLNQADLRSIVFCWMGDQEPVRGAGKGHYYRIHGPTFLIEYDNTQNNANHVHTVVRDLTNDWGEDLLKAHYEAGHRK
ncbi:DUF3500 domain-containing protein [Runella sp. SP2]|uniref:DUF3500 domain-containing protein n=1 Tax=Runella sp. SP2 TaxID=2268026 RepID=UPI0013DDD884|nr:DUF3500 domain-containing protein [Runella sp. SP2]